MPRFAPFTALLAAVLPALLLTACASAPQTVELASDTRAAIKTVAIIVPPEPKQYAVVNMGHPGLALGLLGGFFVAADQDTKQAKFYQAMQFQKFSVKSMLSAALAQKMAEAGYQAKVLDGPWV